MAVIKYGPNSATFLGFQCMSFVFPNVLLSLHTIVLALHIVDNYTIKLYYFIWNNQGEFCKLLRVKEKPAITRDI